MESPKKNPDKINTIGIVTVGAVGSALVYLSIVGLQAFYVGETSRPDSLAAFGDQDKARASLKAGQIGNLVDVRPTWNTPEGKHAISIPIDAAKALIVRDARVDPANLVPHVRRSDRPSAKAIFGRPVALPAAPVPPVEPPPVEPPPIAPGDPITPPGGVPGAVPPGTAPAPAPTPAAPAPAAPATPAPAAGAQ